jgi:hypothetical protein
VRLHGRGRVVLPGDAEWAALRPQFPAHASARAVIAVQLARISDSCGFGVPRLEFAGERDELPQWAAKKGDDGLSRYRRDKNARSIDGLPAIDPAP